MASEHLQGRLQLVGALVVPVAVVCMCEEDIDTYTKINGILQEH